MAKTHKLIQGGEQWLPFAEGRLRALNPVFAGKHVSQRYIMSDGADVHVQIVGEQQFIRISGGGAEYEFWATDHVNGTTGRSPGFEQFPGWRVGSAVRMAKSGKAAPLYSTTLAPPSPAPGEEPEWPLREFDYEPLVTDSAAFKTWGSWQTLRCFEYATWPGNRDDSVVVSCQAQAPGWNSQLNWMSSRMSHRLVNFGIYRGDIGLDVIPIEHSKTGARGSRPEFPQPWVWYRRATTQSVGGQTFFIHSDNIGRFHIYRAQPLTDLSLTTAIPASQYKTYTPPYPAWVTVPDPSNYENQQRHWLWAFDSEGKRAVTCPFHAVRGEFYKHLEPGLREATVLPEQLAELDVPEGAMVQSFEDTPGLVEFGIEIALTGPGEMDFEATFTLLRNDYFPTSGRFIFDAAYALPYKGKGEKKAGYPAPDTLLTAEMQCLVHDAGHYEPGPMAAGDCEREVFIDRVRDVQAKWVFNANDDNMAPAELLRLHAWGPYRGQFLNNEGFRARQNPLVPGDTALQSYYNATLGENLPQAAGGVKFYGANGAVSNREALPPMGHAVAGYLFALELRTLSMTYENAQTGVAGKAKAVLVHHLEEAVNVPLGVIGGVDPTIEYRPVGTVPVPPAGLNIYMHLFTTALDTDWGQGFTVHPAGHWSHSLRGSSGPAFDIVQPRKGKRTSHRALFNKAFGQARDYGYYSESYPGKPPVGAVGHGDLGSFRSAGVWITF